MDDPLVIATVVTAVGTLILAIATLYLARKTGGMVQEMQIARSVQERPYVVVDLDYSRRNNFVYIVVRNDGIRSARNIGFEFSAPIWSRAYAKGSSEADISMEVGYFRSGIAVLAPNAEIPCLWDNTEHVIETIRSEILPMGSRSRQLTSHSKESPTKTLGSSIPSYSQNAA